MDDVELAALKESNPKVYEFISSQKAELEKFKAAPPAKEPIKEDHDLKAKAQIDRDAIEKAAKRDKSLESALRFNLKSQEFLKQNESLLPKEVADIFNKAETENFSDAIEKDAAIKSGIIQSFFSIQENMDLLTAGQKHSLDEYLKLTKNGKQERASTMYDMVFEPAFEMLKRIKKATALAKGHSNDSNSDEAYKAKLHKMGAKKYLGENTNA